MRAPVIAALLSLASSAPALAGTFVYVSNAEDGDIGMYKLQAEGSLQPGQRFKAEKLVMPTARNNAETAVIWSRYACEEVPPSPEGATDARRSRRVPADSVNRSAAPERSQRAIPTSRLIVAVASSSARPTARTKWA